MVGASFDFKKGTEGIRKTEDSMDKIEFTGVIWSGQISVIMSLPI